VEPSREAFDEAVANMSVQASKYFQEYVFYMHLLAKCRVVFDPGLPAVAGVTYHQDHYIILINPLEVIGTVYEEDGSVKEEILGFSLRMPLEQRLGIIKHEMLHIALGHLFRVDDRDFGKYNKSADCALNQEIPRNHLPDYAIYPDNLTVRKEIKIVPERQTAELYYELMPDPEEGEGGKDGSQGGMSGKTMSGKTPGRCVDDHGLWKEIEGDSELQKEITKNMVESAGNSTMKSKGTLPSTYAQMIENLTTNREVDWQKLLRTITGNKRANKRSTIMRRDRRSPNAGWIKGKTKDRVFELAVISDVSGSVGDGALLAQWGAIINLCETYNIKVKLVQIDTVASEPVELDRNSKVMERTGHGGTLLFSAVQKLKDCGIKFDAIVVTTDGELFGQDVLDFQGLRVPLIWLIEPTGTIMDGMDGGRMTAVKLKKAA
jgi:predicted metal-dependent peptidase